MSMCGHGVVGVSLHFLVRFAMALDNEDKPLLVAAVLQLSTAHVLDDIALDVKKSFAGRDATLPTLFIVTNKSVAI